MPVLTEDMVAVAVATGGSCRVDEKVEGRFAPDDAVRVRNLNPSGHTRLPRYARGKVGTVVADRGVFVFPDTSAHGRGDKPQHVYSVRFSSQDLWGPETAARDMLYLDLWDDYLDHDD